MTPGIPAYFSPEFASADWRTLAGLPKGSVVIVNPASGPSPTMRAVYADHVRALRDLGIRVYGYVDSSYGARSLRQVAADAMRFRVALGVDGVFIDQVAPDRRSVRRLARIRRAMHAVEMTIAVNPGQPGIHLDAFSLFDEVVVFEGSMATYLDTDLPAWEGPARTWHLVYDVPEGERDAVYARGAAHGASLIYATDGIPPNPWGSLPATFAEEWAATARGPGRPAGCGSGWGAPHMP